MSTESPAPRRRRFFIFLGVGALLAVFALPVAFASGAGHGFGTGFGMHCDRSDLSAEQFQRRADRAAMLLLDRVDATEAQREEGEAMLDGVGQRAFDVRGEHEVLRAEWQEAFLAEQIDEQQVEALRVAMLERADEGSSEILGLVTDIAQILTAEQRQELHELAERWHR